MMVLIAGIAGMADLHAQKAIISGRVLGYDGQPLPKAAINITRLNVLKPLGMIEAAKDGSFTFASDESGLMVLEVSGVDHQMQQVAIILGDSIRAELTVRLQPYTYYKSFDSVRVIGDFNDFSYATARKMERLEDGCYELEIPTTSATLAYQLIGITDAGAVNAPGAEEYAYEGGLFYRSIARAKNGKVKIAFDTTQLIYTKKKAEVHFDNPRLDAVAGIYNDILLRREQYQRALADNRKAGRTLNEFSFSWAKVFDKLSKQLALEKDSVVREMLLVSYLDLGTLDGARQIRSGIARWALAATAPTSPVWSINPKLMTLAIEKSDAADTTYQGYLDQAVNNHADPNVCAMLLYDELTVAYNTKQPGKARRYYERLTNDFSSSRYAAMARVQFTISRDEEPEQAAIN